MKAEIKAKNKALTDEAQKELKNARNARDEANNIESRALNEFSAIRKTGDYIHTEDYYNKTIPGWRNMEASEWALAYYLLENDNFMAELEAKMLTHKHSAKLLYNKLPFNWKENKDKLSALQKIHLQTANV
jgi:hypothetical protein